MKLYKIYKLSCNVTDKIVYGKTKQSMEDKLDELRQQYRYYISKLVKRSYSCDILENKNYTIEVLMQFKDSALCARAFDELLRNSNCLNRIIDVDAEREIKRINKANKSKEYRAKHFGVYTCAICNRCLTTMAKIQHAKSKIHLKAIDNIINPEP